MNFEFLTEAVPTGEKATYLDWVLRGMGMSAGTGLAAFAIALILGIALGVARTRPGMTGKLTNAVFAVVRSIPLMSMLFLAYYVIPAVFFPEAVKHIAFVTLTLTAGILGLAVFTAQALGFSTCQSYTLVMLPQAIKQAMPALTNEFLSCVKNTSAISTIGLIELSRQTQNIIDNTSAIYEAFLAICTCYLIINGVILLMTKTINEYCFTNKETI